MPYLEFCRNVPQPKIVEPHEMAWSMSEYHKGDHEESFGALVDKRVKNLIRADQLNSLKAQEAAAEFDCKEGLMSE